MINERNQEAFLELIRPPLGYKLTYSIGTTFTLELPCLVQMALNSRGSKKLVEELTVHEGFETINDFASKSMIFTQNCRIKGLPPELIQAGNTQKGRFFVLLDSMVSEVPTESQLSAFHPKVWFLRFDSDEVDGGPIFKQFTMSRNLTSALNWDVSLCLIGKKGKGSNKNKELRDFLDLLLKKSSSRKRGSELIKSAIEDLKFIDFELPDKKTYKRANFSYKWGKKKGFSPLRLEEASRVVVVSPFMSENQLQKLKNIKNLHLVTSSADLDKVNRTPELHDKTYIFNIEGMELHSKMYFVERESHSDVILGSTNFTNSAWFGDNVEAHVHLETARNSVEKFIAEFIFDGEGRPNNWLKKFEAIDKEPDQEEEELQKIERQFDKTQGFLATGEFVLNYKNGMVELSYEGERILLPKGYKGSVSIVGTKSSLDLENVLSKGEKLADVKVGDLSSFLAIQLKYKKEVRHFCTIAMSNFSRYERNKSILSNSIRDWESFWDYLGVVLNIESVGGASHDVSPRDHKVKSGRRKTKTTKWRYLEPVLLAGVSDPGVIDKIDTAISALKSNKKEQMNEENLKSFLSFWKEYKSAYEEFKRHG